MSELLRALKRIEYGMRAVALAGRSCTVASYTRCECKHNVCLDYNCVRCDWEG